jgi:CPA1 family monovalent cation:H+ antiporter
MTADLSVSLLIVCGFLVAVSAIQRYASNFIIPGVTIMMFIGAISVIVPLYSSDIETVYDSIVNKAPDLILLVFIPLLIFESASGYFAFISLVYARCCRSWDIGYAGDVVLKKWQADDHVNFTLSIALAIGGYIIGDHVLHVSGVVTTVFTALLMLRTHKETFIGIGRLFNMYWDYLGFITNSILFFLIGIPVFSLFLLQSGALWVLIIIAPFVIVMISRAIVIYGGSIVLRIANVRLPLQWQNILTLGGLRGGICVALVLSLPAEYEFKNLFVTLTISLIAINLIINPILLDRYLKKSKIMSQQVS